MNKELIETITRLVLERIIESESQSLYTKPLEEPDLVEWNHIHAKKDDMKFSGQYMQPLSKEEVKDWALMNQLSHVRKCSWDTTNQTSMGMVKFSKVIS